MRIAPMWETENALYHFREKDRAEYHTGEKPNLKYAVLDRDFFISTWQRKDMDGIHEIFDTEKEAYNYIFDQNKSFYLDKIDALFAEKTEELNVRVIAYQFDEEKTYMFYVKEILIALIYHGHLIIQVKKIVHSRIFTTVSMIWI